MTKQRNLLVRTASLVFLSASFLLAGCNSQSTSASNTNSAANGGPVGAPKNADQQMKAIDSNPNIPVAKKAEAKTSVANGEGFRAYMTQRAGTSK